MNWGTAVCSGFVHLLCLLCLIPLAKKRREMRVNGIKQMKQIREREMMVRLLVSALCELPFGNPPII